MRTAWMPGMPQADWRLVLSNHVCLTTRKRARGMGKRRCDFRAEEQRSSILSPAVFSDLPIRSQSGTGFILFTCRLASSAAL